MTTGGTKRSRTEGATSAGSAARGAAAGDPTKEMLGNLPMTLGEGEHERSIMKGILVAFKEIKDALGKARGGGKGKGRGKREE